jgi:proteasome lid subunit RPN8/RPN11
MGDSQLWFDFSGFTKTAHLKTNDLERQSRPEDFPFETAYNDPPGHAFLSILYKKIELNKNHVPTKRGWKTLYNFISMYRSKQYETVRYLLLDKNGDIVDHVAITNRIPNRALVYPDSMTGGEYFRKLTGYVFKNDYKIIMVHNHPSGVVEPSEKDREVTEYIMWSFGKNFAGHLILDHGSFGLYIPGKDWETVSLKSVDHDPLVKQNRHDLFNTYELDSDMTPEKMMMLNCVLKIDDGPQWNSRDWVAVVFTSGRGDLKALHYYHTSEFCKDEASYTILKKTVDIASRSGAVRAFAFSEYDAMLEPIKSITQKTGVFKDFYVNGVIGNKLGIGGSVHQYFSHPTEVDSTIFIENEQDQQQSSYGQKADLPVAATAIDTVSEFEYHFF